MLAGDAHLLLLESLDRHQDALVVVKTASDGQAWPVIYANDAFDRIFAGELGPLPSKTLDRLPEAVARHALEAARHYSELGGQRPNIEMELKGQDGSARWFTVSTLVKPDDSTRNTLILLSFLDISAQKAAELAMADRDRALAEAAYWKARYAANQDRFLAVMDAYPEPIAVFDREDRLAFWNRAFSSTVTDDPADIHEGLGAAEIVSIGTQTGKFKSPSAPERQWLTPLDGSNKRQSIVDLALSENRHYRVLHSQTSMDDRVVMCLDTTAMVAQREKAKKERARLVAALNASPDPIVIYDENLGLICWNKAYAELNIFDPDADLEGVHLKDVLMNSAKSGRYPEAIGCEDEWVDGILSAANQQLPWEDVVLQGDRYYRLSRSRSVDGDFVAIFMNTTDFVRQKRTAQAAQDRLIAALNAYPSPFAIYDADSRLVVWNHAYRISMTNDPDGLSAGMPIQDAAALALQEGKLKQQSDRGQTWLKSVDPADVARAYAEDIEQDYDQHYRVIKTHAENGDIMLLQIDMTELVRQRRQHEATQNRLVSAINAFPDPFSIYDNNLKLLLWNPAYARSMSNNPENLKPGTSLKDILHTAAHAGKFRDAIGQEDDWVKSVYRPDMLKPGIEDVEFSEDVHYRMVRSLTDDGEYVVLGINISEVVKQRREVERYARKLEEANTEITHKALHDELTGLGNRRYLSHKLEEVRKRREVEGGEIAVLHIDLDRFKQINDTMGHAAGDYVLKEAANIICARLHPDDVVARIGGDEFVVLLYLQKTKTRAMAMADALIDDFSCPLEFEGRECRYGASIGVAATPLTEVADLLTNSDVALYNAKNAGRAQVSLFNISDLQELKRNKALADDILRGLAADEFVPFFQPQVDARTGEMLGMEALARWNHPVRGILAPDAFLSTATDLNVAADIDKTIFEKAIVSFQDAFGHRQVPPALSFNVSANRIKKEDIDTIEYYANFYSGKIAFELLETIFLEEENTEFLFQLDRLRDLGISIEIDDFGSGRASIVALQRIAPDRIKIDRRLVAPMHLTKGGMQLVQSITEIGLALDIGITAEGVETKEQAEKLAELGCDRLQGYYFGKPVALDQLISVTPHRNRA